MSITMSKASVPMFTQLLSALLKNLDKAEEHAATHAIEEVVLLNARLYPDMHPLIAQVRIACDFAKGAVARLSGMPVPSFADDEESFADLKARVAKTLDFINSVDPLDIDGSEARAIVLKFGGAPISANGQDFLVGYAIPSMVFHVSTAFAILRHNGVAIGKRDFLGQVAGMTGL
jgi:uncharacterized protein